MASNTDVVKKLYYNMSVLCLYLCVCMMFQLPRIVDDDSRGSFHDKSSRAVSHRICGPSRIIQLLRQECYTE